MNNIEYPVVFKNVLWQSDELGDRYVDAEVYKVNEKIVAHITEWCCLSRFYNEDFTKADFASNEVEGLFYDWQKVRGLDDD